MLIVPVITVIGLIPVTINGIGLREGAFVFIFTQMGVTASQSLILSLLYRLGIIILSLVGGVLYIIDDINNKVVKNKT